MDFQFPVNTSPEAGAFQALQRSPHMRSAPPSRRPPVPGQPRGHAGTVRDAVVPPANAASDHRPYEDWEDMLSPIDQPQDLRYGDMGHYDMANNHLPPNEHHNHAINNYAGLALDAPAQAQAAPLAPTDVFDGIAQDPAAGPAQAFRIPGEWPHSGPVPNDPATEALRQLAILYLREPNSQVALIRMEPGHAHGVRVVVTVELAGF